MCAGLHSTKRSPPAGPSGSRLGGRTPHPRVAGGQVAGAAGRQVDKATTAQLDYCLSDRGIAATGPVRWPPGQDRKSCSGPPGVSLQVGVISPAIKPVGGIQLTGLTQVRMLSMAAPLGGGPCSAGALLSRAARVAPPSAAG